MLYRITWLWYRAGSFASMLPWQPQLHRIAHTRAPIIFRCCNRFSPLPLTCTAKNAHNKDCPPCGKTGTGGRPSRCRRSRISLRAFHSFFQQYVERLNSHVYFRPRKEKSMSLLDIKYTIRRGIEIENANEFIPVGMKGASTHIGPRLDNHGIDIHSDGIIAESDGVPLYTKPRVWWKGEWERVLLTAPLRYFAFTRQILLRTRVCLPHREKRKNLCVAKIRNESAMIAGVFQFLDKISFITLI